jgi:hypothetical protein
MEKPWIDGPRELLFHAEEHLNLKSDFDKRIAFISIDNAVELTIKTYLGLPKRIRKTSGPSRKELQDAENSFPTYLDLLEKYDADKLIGINLEDIEWYHRLRNQLYHSGNGITVNLAKLETYFEIAKTLFESLFSIEYQMKNTDTYDTNLGIFIGKWIIFEKKLRSKLPPKDDFAYHWKRDFLSKIDIDLVPNFDKLSNFKNKIIHGIFEPTEEELLNMSKNIDFIMGKI